MPERGTIAHTKGRRFAVRIDPQDAGRATLFVVDTSTRGAYAIPEGPVAHLGRGALMQLRSAIDEALSDLEADDV